MNVEFDSDLSDISEAETDQAAPIRPYQYEPVINTVEVSSGSDGDSDSDTSVSSNDHELGDDSIPDVSNW